MQTRVKTLGRGLEKLTAYVLGISEKIPNDFAGSLQDHKRTYFGPVNIEKMAVKLLLGIGYADMTEQETGVDFSQVVADLGINFTVLKAQSGPVKGEIALNALYRHLKFAEEDLNFAPGEDVSKLGGFVIGMNAGLFF